MEQLINAATPYNYAMLAFLFFGVGSICFGIIIFIVSAMAAGKELLIMLNLGGILIITGLHFGNICNKYDDQITAIIKPVISESIPMQQTFFIVLMKALLQRMILNTRFSTKRLSKMKINL